ncbi:MAG: asparagine synthase (glutamine-hydrolyzing) [bacterium]
MCGVCGYAYLDPRRPAAPENLAPMIAALSHRGPDESGAHVEKNAALGHTRLSIIDLASGSQPLANEDRSVWISYNGEIYNFKELRNTLSSLGHAFTTNTDTEVIVHLYEEHGAGCLERLRGMFAFCLWDKKNEILFLARDRVGIKPLYYYLDSEKIVFASELKSILRFKDLSLSVSLKALDYYFTFLYIPGAETIFKGIKKLPPGHFLTLRGGAAELKSYWKFQPAPDVRRTASKTAADAADLLADAVRVRLVSDVPLGAFLSGGVDSGAIVAMMSRFIPSVKTFSIGFTERRWDETPYARMVAERYRTDHHEFVVTPDPREIASTIIPCFDEPFADASAVPTWYLSKLARGHVKTVLSGDGGDEAFLGYRQYWSAKINSLLLAVPRSVREKFILKLVRAFLPSPQRGANLLSRIRFLWERNVVPPELQFILSRQVFSDDAKRELFASADPFPAFDPADYVRDCLASPDPLEANALADFKMYLPDDILTKVDRMSMANSLEVRVPLLDHLLLEYLMTVPWKMKFPGLSLRSSKFILKKIARRLLPPEIVSRPKHGFEAPVRRWLHNELMELTLDCLSRDAVLKRGFFNYDYVRKLLPGARKLQDPRFDTAYDTWALLVFEIWCRTYLDSHG